MKKFIAIFIALVAFTACSVNVDKGTVSDKRVKDAYTSQVEITEEVCEWEKDKKTRTKTVNGKTKTETYYVDEYDCDEEGTGEYKDVYHEAQYFVTLEDKDGNDEEHKVSKEEYDSLAVGDTADFTK